jgi:hypothetical protein
MLVEVLGADLLLAEAEFCAWNVPFAQEDDALNDVILIGLFGRHSVMGAYSCPHGQAEADSRQLTHRP